MALYENSDYGRRLLPSVLDELAKHNPDRLYAAIPRTGNISDGFSDVTVADLARCVDFTSRWLEDRVGRSNSFETITYIGVSDLRGVVVFLAAVKCGYKVGFCCPEKTEAKLYAFRYYYHLLETLLRRTCP